MIELIGRSVLDTPRARGTTTVIPCRQHEICITPVPCNCAVKRSIASATSRHCASQLRGKRNVRSAPSTRRSLRHMPGVVASRRAARGEVRRVGEEQIFAAVGRAVAKRAHRQTVLARASRPARDSADRWCGRGCPAPACHDAPRSTGRSGRSAAWLPRRRVGADMLRRLGSLERRDRRR